MIMAHFFTAAVYFQLLYQNHFLTIVKLLFLWWGYFIDQGAFLNDFGGFLRFMVVFMVEVIFW